jgi:hypothetical protein
MTAELGHNLGLTSGYAPADDGWGAAMNADIRLLDGVMLFTTAVGPLNTPPGSPALGDRYIVGTVPTGAWSTHASALAVYQKDETNTSAWIYYTPKEGWSGRVLDATPTVPAVTYLYRGGAWLVQTARNLGELLAQFVLGTIVGNGTFNFVYRAPYAGSVVGLDAETATGSFTLDVAINGTPVTGLSGVAITATPTSTAATGADTFSAGDKITGTISAASGSPTDAVLNLNVTWS